jgi:hypothetical protein
MQPIGIQARYDLVNCLDSIANEYFRWRSRCSQSNP